MKLFLAATLVLLAPYAAAKKSSPAPNLKAIYDFEKGTLEPWSLKRLPVKKDARVITEPVRFGKYAAAVTLAPGVRYKDGWKAELSDSALPGFDLEVWYRVSHYLPEDFTPQKGLPCIVAQWHNNGWAGWSPLLAHYYKDGELFVQIAYGANDEPKSYAEVVNKIFYRGPFEKKRWHDFVYRTKWGKGTEGEVEGWHNGKRMGIYKGPIGYKKDDGGSYFKTGVYCTSSPDRRLTAYVDEYRRGAKREDVLLPGEKLEP